MEVLKKLTDTLQAKNGIDAMLTKKKTLNLLTEKNEGSPYKAMQVWKYRPVLLCKRLIFHHVLPEAIMCN
jgi:hypothetical protein